MCIIYMIANDFILKYFITLIGGLVVVVTFDFSS